MPENQDVLKERLQQLLNQKKSRKYYAKRLGIEEKEVRVLMDRIKRGEEAIEEVTNLSNYVTELEDTVIKFEENLLEAKGELVARVKDEIRTLEELIQKCKIDTTKWTVDRYVQNYWGNSDDPHWQVKAYLSRKSPVDNFQKNFIDFLKDYKPEIKHGTVTPFWAPGATSCLIINKQDEHLNKFDISGDNNIDERFKITYNAIDKIVRQAWIAGNVDEVVYILGSDQFNSEWTGCTVRGTPQTNLAPYQESFEKICQYEIDMIQCLQTWCKKLRIIYVSGNHDEYVGWHLVSWLKAFYRDKENITFDLSPRYRKYIRYGNSAMMFNHGDAMKPPKLAGTFPVEFKDEWSKCDNYYIFTGDKHHELSLDFNGIKFYQLPALSKAKSSWDDKRGYTTSKAELIAFLIDEKQGMTNIYKQQI